MIRNLYNQVHQKSLLSCRLPLYKRSKIEYHNLARISPVIKNREPQIRNFHYPLSLKKLHFTPMMKIKDKGITSFNYSTYHDKRSRFRNDKRSSNNKRSNNGKDFRNDEDDVIPKYLCYSSSTGAIVGGACALLCATQDFIGCDTGDLILLPVVVGAAALLGFLLGPFAPVLVPMAIISQISRMID